MPDIRLLLRCYQHLISRGLCVCAHKLSYGFFVSNMVLPQKNLTTDSGLFYLQGPCEKARPELTLSINVTHFRIYNKKPCKRNALTWFDSF